MRTLLIVTLSATVGAGAMHLADTCSHVTATCEQPADLNGDAVVDLGDVMFLLAYLYQDGPAVAGCGDEPVAACGEPEMWVTNTDVQGPWVYADHMFPYDPETGTMGYSTVILPTVTNTGDCPCRDATIEQVLGQPLPRDQNREMMAWRWYSELGDLLPGQSAEAQNGEFLITRATGALEVEGGGVLLWRIECSDGAYTYIATESKW